MLIQLKVAKQLVSAVDAFIHSDTSGSMIPAMTTKYSATAPVAPVEWTGSRMSCFRRGSTARAARMRLRVEFQRLGGQRNILPRDLIETALAHVIGDKAEQAYRRSDALEKAPQAYGGIGQLLRAKSQFKRFAASKGIG